MAQLQGSHSTYDQIGIREDLTPFISDISPTETPFYANCTATEASNTFFEWQQDALAAAAHNAQEEGKDYSTFTSATPTSRPGNYTQISAKDWIVTGTARSVNTAGRSDEWAYQAAKAGRELKRDMEVCLTENNAAVAGAIDTARETGSVLAFIKTNTDKGTNGADPVYGTQPTDARSDGTTRSWLESILQTVVSATWTSGGEPTLLMVGASLKQGTSAFSGIAGIRTNVEGMTPATIIGAADYYVSDFGVLAVVPNRFMRAIDALVLDPDHMEIAWLRPIQNIDIAKTGDADKGVLLGEWGLRVRNEAAHGLATDLVKA